MTSNIRLQRVCQHCGSDFIAKTTTTRYCGDKCAKYAYKIRKRKEKVEKSEKETIEFKTRPLKEIQQKEFLTVADVSALLGCSRRTVYRLIDNGTINGVNLAERMTRIKRSELDRILEQPKPKENDVVTYNISECYNMAEIQIKYNISRNTINQLIIRNQIPKFQHGKYAYAPKIQIDKIFN